MQYVDKAGIGVVSLVLIVGQIVSIILTIPIGLAGKLAIAIGNGATKVALVHTSTTPPPSHIHHFPVSSLHHQLLPFPVYTEATSVAISIAIGSFLANNRFIHYY